MDDRQLTSPWLIPLRRAHLESTGRIGGKGLALARLIFHEIPVPKGFCIATEAFSSFVDSGGLRERILLELHRKPFEEMRWEEIWDAALRIRHLFLTAPMPSELERPIRDLLASPAYACPLAVRSSSPDEDATGSSFAGLHESFVNLRDADAVLRSVRLVWASLFSDRALLYRKEIGLDFERSGMAVVVQEMISGERSGIVFTRNPNDVATSVIEAVYGLNQGLVDGDVEPDRWIIDRASGRVTEHRPAHRERAMQPHTEGTILRDVPESLKALPPLTHGELIQVHGMALRLEELFGGAQDVEWTFRGGELFILQSRPITTLPGGTESDQRRWYLSLHRSFENLKTLRQRIEEELIPAMTDDARRLASEDLTQLTDRELWESFRNRKSIERKWAEIYWEEYIPFAHGMRLFGQIYNDVMRPADPFEFVSLLGTGRMESLERNRRLEVMASMVRTDAALKQRLSSGVYTSLDAAFEHELQGFISEFGDLSCPITGIVQCTQGPEGLIRLILEMADRTPSASVQRSLDHTEMKERFLEKFPGGERTRAEELLDLAQASYRLRDDDNIHLGRIEAQKFAAALEAQRRYGIRGWLDLDESARDELLRTVPETGFNRKTTVDGEASPQADVKARQLIGQPAGPGIARGPARVILELGDLQSFKRGEVLVCDAVEPNMTFVVPLAAAIIERRGGMLIHGAIIAREYGLPCVTGVPDVTQRLKTGDKVTVDGYLGLVIVNTAEL
jgi:pyruvate,water dikinase